MSPTSRGTIARPTDAAAAGAAVELSPRDVEEMELSFSRGFSPGWLQGCDHKMLVPALSSSKRGVLLGKVKGVRAGRVIVELAGSVKRGDGVAFDCGRPVDDEQGGRVYEVFHNGRSLTEPIASGIVELAFAHGGIRFRRDLARSDGLEDRRPGTYRPLAQDVHRRRSAATYVPSICTCEPKSASRWLSSRRPKPDSNAACNPPNSWPKRRSTLSHKKRSSSNSAGSVERRFELRSVVAEIIGRPMIPFSVLGKLRHELVARLEAAAQAPPVRNIANDIGAANAARAVARRAKSTCRRDAAIACPGAFARHNCKLCWMPARAASMPTFKISANIGKRCRLLTRAEASIYLATPRIQKPDEMGIFHALAKHGADGILVRNLAGWHSSRARHAGASRFLAQLHQRTDGPMADRARSNAPHAIVRFESRPVARSGGRGAAGVAGSGRAPAHADVPHGALRLLRGALARHEQNQLRPPVRYARSATPRPHRHGTSAGRRRRLPQYAVQRRAAKCGRSRARAACNMACGTSASNCSPMRGWMCARRSTSIANCSPAA